MINIIFWLYIFFDILGLLIYIDVILSLLQIFQINIRPKFLENILDPIYEFIKKNIPTSIWVFDFTPMITIFILHILKIVLLVFFPELNNTLQLYTSFNK